MAGNTKTDIFSRIDMTTSNTACWPWKGTWGGRARDRRPYYSYEGTRVIAYRLVYELVHGVGLTREQMILHSCDQGGHPVGCCNPNHMRVGDNKMNMEDMTERQRHGLTTNVIKAIRRLLASGRKQEEIAALYGISRELVSAINTRRAYSHVAEGLAEGTDGSGPGETSVSGGC